MSGTFGWDSRCNSVGEGWFLVLQLGEEGEGGNGGVGWFCEG